MTTVLQLINQANLELGLLEFNSLVSSSDLTAKHIVSLANRAGKDIVAAHKWAVLYKEYLFTTVSKSLTGNVIVNNNTITNINTTGIDKNYIISSACFDSPFVNIGSIITNQITVNLPSKLTAINYNFVVAKSLYDLPLDFDCFVNDTTINNKYLYSEMNFVHFSDKQKLRYFVNNNGLKINYTISNNKIMLVDLPVVNNQIIAFDYISNGFVNSNGIVSNTINFDNDDLIIDEDLFISNLKWRFLQKNGLDYTAHQQEYLQMLDNKISKELPRTYLNAAGDDNRNNTFVPLNIGL